MERRTGDYESGQVVIRRDAADIRIVVHWPFDRETDEWIDVTTVLAAASLAGALRSAEAEINVIDAPDKLHLRRMRDGRFRLGLSGRNSIESVDADLIVPPGIGEQIFESLHHALLEDN